MVTLIGVVLLVYGIIGVAATILVYWWFRRPQGPLQRLRKLLGDLSVKMRDSVGLTERSIALAGTAGDILQSTHDKLDEIEDPLRRVAGFLGDAAQSIESVEQTLDSVEVPVLAPSTASLHVDFTADVVSEVSLSSYRDPLDTFTFWGPPIGYTRSPLGVKFGPTEVITGLGLTTAHPLRSVGQAFGVAGTKIAEAGTKIDEIGNMVGNVKDFTLEARSVANEVVKYVLEPLRAELQDAHEKTEAISGSPLLVLLPLPLLAYFGLIHVAFALTGLALLVV